VVSRPPWVIPSTQDAVHAELAKVLGQYSEQELANVFVVIEPAGHRTRRLHEAAPDSKSPPRST
jgi:hypothetical protein